MNNFLIMIFLATAFIFPQKNADEIISRVKEKYENVNDYVVDVSIKVDINFIKVPDSKAKIYFKKPDKTHIETDGFALLPKEGLNFSPASYLKGEYTSIFVNEENYKGNKTNVVKIIPSDNSSDIILSTLWIDEKKNVVHKIETTTKTAGTFTIELTYSDKAKYGMPSNMVFSFNLDKLQLPRSLTGEIQAPKNEANNKETVGKVYVNYDNYKINIGIKDSVFDK